MSFSAVHVPHVDAAIRRLVTTNVPRPSRSRSRAPHVTAKATRGVVRPVLGGEPAATLQLVEVLAAPALFI